MHSFSDDNGNCGQKRKPTSQLEPVSTRPRMNKLYISRVLGDLEIFWMEQTELQDSNTYPLFSSVRNKNRFATANNIIMVARRRSDVSRDVPARNDEDIYSRRYYVRAVDPNTSTGQSRLEFLVDVAEVRKYESYLVLQACVNRANILCFRLAKFLNDHSSQRTGRFIMPNDFDRTPAELKSVDNYLMTTDVVVLVKHVYLEPSGQMQGWKGWYEWVGKSEADYFFTPPFYPYMAVTQLGYPTQMEQADAEDSMDEVASDGAESS